MTPTHDPRFRGEPSLDQLQQAIAFYSAPLPGEPLASRSGEPPDDGLNCARGVIAAVLIELAIAAAVLVALLVVK